MSLSKDDKAYIDTSIRVEVNRLEILIDDVRNDTTKILELLGFAQAASAKADSLESSAQ